MAANDPIGFAKGGRDVRSLCVGQGTNRSSAGILDGCGEPSGQRTQHAARRYDECALDEILQFPDIARPFMTPY